MFKPQAAPVKDRARRRDHAVWPWRRPAKSKARRLHEQAEFWFEHGEKFRLVLIGGGMVFLAAFLVTLAFG